MKNGENGNRSSMTRSVYITGKPLRVRVRPAPERDDPELLECARAGHHVRVREILDDPKVNIDLRDEGGQTALMNALVKGYFNVAVILIKNGANIFIPDHQGNTALHLLAKYGRAEYIQIGLNMGVDVDCANNDGQTPLMAAAAHFSDEAVLSLLKGGADPNLTDKNGQSALFYATRKSSYLVCQRLLEYGADIDIPNKKGMKKETIFETLKIQPHYMTSIRDRQEKIKKILDTKKAEKQAVQDYIRKSRAKSGNFNAAADISDTLRQAAASGRFLKTVNAGSLAAFKISVKNMTSKNMRGISVMDILNETESLSQLFYISPAYCERGAVETLYKSCLRPWQQKLYAEDFLAFKTAMAGFNAYKRDKTTPSLKRRPKFR